MALEYARALLLTIVFMTVNFVTGALLFGAVEEAARNPGLTEQWTKLLMAPPFVLGVLAAGVLILLWSGGVPAARRFTGLDLDRPLPATRAPRSILRAPTVWIALLLLLPASVQVLGAELETLSRIVVPYPELYTALQELLSPKGSFVDVLGAFLTLAVIGPVCEELLFRGMILGGFAARAEETKNGSALLVAPLLFQALLFGLAHLNPWQFAYALPMGYLLGWLRVRTGSLWPSILLHCGNNAIAVLMVYFAPPLPYLNAGIYSAIEHVPIPLLIVAALVCAGAIYLIQRSTRTAEAGGGPSPRAEGESA